MVFFLVKCAVVLAVLFMVLPWRDGDASRRAARRHETALSTAAKLSRAKAPDSVPHRDANLLSSLTRDGTEGLTDAARARCLAHPRECLSAAETLRRAISGPESGSRGARD